MLQFTAQLSSDQRDAVINMSGVGGKYSEEAHLLSGENVKCLLGRGDQN